MGKSRALDTISVKVTVPGSRQEYKSLRSLVAPDTRRLLSPTNCLARRDSSVCMSTPPVEERGAEGSRGRVAVGDDMALAKSLNRRSTPLQALITEQSSIDVGGVAVAAGIGVLIAGLVVGGSLARGWLRQT